MPCDDCRTLYLVGIMNCLLNKSFSAIYAQLRPLSAERPVSQWPTLGEVVYLGSSYHILP